MGRLSGVFRTMRVLQNFSVLALSGVFALLNLSVPATQAQAPGATPAPVQYVNTTGMNRVQDVHTPIPLWPKGAPGALGKAETDIPTVAVYLPSANPAHTAVVVAPGGGYTDLAIDHEGLQVAQWLNAHGVAALVLKYRLGPAYHHPIELGDAQRAIRYARSQAAAMDVQPDHIGMWGFSAGGHLAATAGTKFDAGNTSAPDPVEQVSSRPDFLILAYPVISMENGITHPGSQKNLLGENADPAMKKLLSADEQVTPQTPPTFLFSTTDDTVVPVNNSVLFYQALVRNNVPAELHIYRRGHHGLGLAQADPEVSGWTDQLYYWMHENGWAQ